MAASDQNQRRRTRGELSRKLEPDPGRSAGDQRTATIELHRSNPFAAEAPVSAKPFPQ